MNDKDTAERRGTRAAVKAFLGVVALGLAYAIFNERMAELDRRRHGWGRKGAGRS